MIKNNDLSDIWEVGIDGHFPMVLMNEWQL